MVTAKHLRRQGVGQPVPSVTPVAQAVAQKPLVTLDKHTPNMKRWAAYKAHPPRQKKHRYRNA